MADRVAAVGVVSTVPRLITTADGLTICGFRLATGVRAGDRHRLPRGTAPGSYVVTALDTLALTAAGSLRPGDRVVVRGALILHRAQGHGEGRGGSADGCSRRHDGVVAEVWAESIRRAGAPGADGEGARKAGRNSS